MVITGAGPGIMEAGNKGAGIDNSFGVNIRLPFESDANAYIHESRLINYKYFFTRKLMFMKESHAFAHFPGGFGTLDETFELLTLVQTGKSDLHPIVLIEAEGTGYWDGWLEFVKNDLLENGMITPNDPDLFMLTTLTALRRRPVDPAVDAHACTGRHRTPQRHLRRCPDERRHRSGARHRHRDRGQRPSRTPPAPPPLRPQEPGPIAVDDRRSERPGTPAGRSLTRPGYPMGLCGRFLQT